MVAGETSVNLDSQWAYDDACLLRESLAEEVKGAAAGGEGVNFDEDVKGVTATPGVSDKYSNKIVGGHVTPGSVDKANASGGWESELTEQIQITPFQKKGQAKVVTGGKIRVKGQPETGGVASSLEWSKSKRVCGEV